MEQIESGENPTLPVLIFNALAKSAGTTVLRQVFEYAEKTLEAGGKGVTLEDEDTASWALSVDETRSVNFHFHGWGPLSLALETATEVLDTTEEIDHVLRQNAD